MDIKHLKVLPVNISSKMIFKSSVDFSYIQSINTTVEREHRQDFSVIIENVFVIKQVYFGIGKWVNENQSFTFIYISSKLTDQ